MAVLAICGMHQATAQETATVAAETEFPKGWRFPLELAQGPVPTPGMYTGWASLGAMATVVPGHLRLGLFAGPALLGTDVAAVGGVRAAWRVKTFDTAFGSWGNAQVVAEHVWTTESTALAGGGLAVEAGELVLVGLKGYWSYTDGSSEHPAWLQFSIGLNILKGKPEAEIDDPFLNP